MFKIEDFCADSSDEIREYLYCPFVFKGKSYASNGHIAVCVPASESSPDSEGSFGRIISGLFEAANFDAGLEPLPAYPAIELPKCKVCDGVGKREPLQECPECRGEGFVEWDSGQHFYDADCKECDGDAEVRIADAEDVTCERCGGAGTEMDVPVMFGETAINYRYLKLMETLPGLLVGLSGRKFPDVIPFKFDGGVGLVMPIRPDIRPVIPADENASA